MKTSAQFLALLAVAASGRGLDLNHQAAPSTFRLIPFVSLMKRAELFRSALF